MAEKDENTSPTGAMITTWSKWFNAIGLCVAAFLLVGGALAHEWGFVALGLFCVSGYVFSRYMKARG